MYAVAVGNVYVKTSSMDNSKIPATLDRSKGHTERYASMGAKL